MSETEMRSRREIFFESYKKIKNIEARTMLEMTMRDIIPAVTGYVGRLSESINATRVASKAATVGYATELVDKLSALLGKTYDAYYSLERALKLALQKPDDEAAAFAIKTSVIPKMSGLRKVVDEMETLTARDVWPMPTYGDIIFKI